MKKILLGFLMVYLLTASCAYCENENSSYINTRAGFSKVRYARNMNISISNIVVLNNVKDLF